MPTTSALLVGGPLSGQYREMPDDQLVVKVMRDNGRPATYARVQVTREGHAHEVWGWAPLCYRQVKDKFLALEEA